MMTEAFWAVYFVLLGWLSVRRHCQSAGILMALAFPAGLAIWGLGACLAFALHVPLVMPPLSATIMAAAAGLGLIGSRRPTGTELSALALSGAVAAATAILAVMAQASLISEDGRWYLVIGEQLHQWQGMAPTLKAQLGTRPFLFPLFIALANSVGLPFFSFLEPLSALACLGLLLRFGSLLAPASLGRALAIAVPASLALALALSPPFVWSALYFNPHIYYALFLTAAVCCLLQAVRTGENRWLWPFALTTLPLAMIRVEGSLTALALLVAALATPGPALYWRRWTVAIIGALQALWHLFVLISTFAHGGLTVYQIILFGVAPGGVSLLALGLPLLKNGRAEAGLRYLPAAFLAALALGAITHEIVWPFSTLRAAMVFGSFFLNPQTGLWIVAIVVGAGLLTRILRGQNRLSRIVGTVIAGHLLSVLIIAAHSPHQNATITDSTNRMLLHVLPLLYLYPLASAWGTPESHRGRLSPRLYRLALTSLAGLLAAFIGLCVWLYTERGYVRILPVPLAIADTLYSGAQPALAFTPSRVPDLPAFDLETDQGVIAATKFVRGWGPIQGQLKSLPNTASTPEWLDNLRHTAMYCTDATHLMMLLAARQGYRVREVHLFHDPGEWTGNAHTVMEFWSDRRQQWVGIDAQTATLYRYRPDNRLLDVASAAQIPTENLILEQLVPEATAFYNPENLLRKGENQIKINMITPSWLGQGHFRVFLGYALMTKENGHPRKVTTSKLGVIFLLILAPFIWRLGYVVVRHHRHPLVAKRNQA